MSPPASPIYVPNGPNLRESPIDLHLARRSIPCGIPFNNRRDSFGSYAVPVDYDDSDSRARHGHSEKGGLDSFHHAQDGGRGIYRYYYNGNKQYPLNGQRSHHQDELTITSLRFHEGGGLRRGSDCYPQVQPPSKLKS